MRRFLLFFILGGVSPIGAIAFSASAQIVPDTTLPTNSTLRLENNTTIIEGGTKIDGNLFHSFREFSVPTGNSAYFNNGLEIQNIISRITGNNPSNIDGIIRANGSANLFLLNPRGVIFGPNAKLEIGGSLSATSANGLQFPENKEFPIPSQMPPLLTLRVPVGLQAGIPPANIAVQEPGNITTIESIVLGNIGGNPGIPNQRLLTNGAFSMIPPPGVSGNQFLTPKEGMGSTRNQVIASATRPSRNTATSDLTILAFSCITRGNQNSFTITGTGGLPTTPYDQIGGRFNLATVQNISSTMLKAPETGVSSTDKTDFWKIGDRISEAQTIVKTADGRTMLVSEPQNQAIASANDSICQ